MSKKILLFYITEHSGHHQASLVLEDAFKKIDPEIKTVSINYLNYLSPVLGKISSGAYIKIMKSFPMLWGFFYDNPIFFDSFISSRDLIYKLSFKKLKNLLDNFKPDAIVCTQAFPCGAIAYHKKILKDDIPLIGVLTDFSPHSYWGVGGIDLFIVPTGEAKQGLINKGIPQIKIRDLGIPINLKFCQSLDREKIFKKLELKQSLPIILLMGGSRGIGNLEKIINLLDRLELEFQLLIVTGRNRRIKRYLKNKINTFRNRKNMRVFGFTENIYQLMEISDLLISKPGGLTTAEALAKNLPMMIINPIPGQEEKNAQFLVKNGIGIKVDEENLDIIIKNLLNNPEKINQMRSAAQNYARPQAAMETAKLILDLLIFNKDNFCRKDCR